jgi:hypothetical protein
MEFQLRTKIIKAQYIDLDSKTLDPAKRKTGVNFQLHHRLSKFEVPVVVNLKHFFNFLGFTPLAF